jgi:hypothetical protein
MTGDSVLKCVACLEPAPEEWQKMARGPGSHSWHCGCDGSQRQFHTHSTITRAGAEPESWKRRGKRRGKKTGGSSPPKRWR